MVSPDFNFTTRALATCLSSVVCLGVVGCQSNTSEPGVPGGPHSGQPGREGSGTGGPGAGGADASAQGQIASLRAALREHRVKEGRWVFDGLEEVLVAEPVFHEWGVTDLGDWRFNARDLTLARDTDYGTLIMSDIVRLRMRDGRMEVWLTHRWEAETMD